MIGTYFNEIDKMIRMPLQLCIEKGGTTGGENFNLYMTVCLSEKGDML